MKREIDITYPDGSIHHVIVYQADRTSDGRIVISYYDITENMQDSFTEIININGEYLKKPSHQDWNQYESCFEPFNREFSDSIISSLSDEMRLYHEMNHMEEPTPPVNMTEMQTQRSPIDNNKPRISIRMVLFANEGGSRVNIYPTTSENGEETEQHFDLLNTSSFFTKTSLSSNASEFYSKYKIGYKERKAIIDFLISNFGYKFDISTLPELEISSGSNKHYYIGFSSCDDWDLLTAVKAADSLDVDISNVENATYPDNLSSALHYELPLDINIGDMVISKPAFSHKKSSL